MGLKNISTHHSPAANRYIGDLTYRYPFDHRSFATTQRTTIPAGKTMLPTCSAEIRNVHILRAGSDDVNGPSASGAI